MRHRQEFNGRIIEDASSLDSWLTTGFRKYILFHRMHGIKGGNAGQREKKLFKDVINTSNRSPTK